KTEICAGDSVTFTAKPVNGGDSPDYTWFVNGKPVPNVSGDTYSYAPENGDEIVVQLLSHISCTENPEAISNKIIISVTDGRLVAVDLIPEQPEVCAGESVVFEAIPVNGGSNPNYRWFVNGNEMSGETA